MVLDDSCDYSEGNDALEVDQEDEGEGYPNLEEDFNLEFLKYCVELQSAKIVIDEPKLRNADADCLP